MLLLWAILLIIVAVALGFVAFGGIAIAVSSFTKFFFFLSLLCFLVALILITIEKIRTSR